MRNGSVGVGSPVLDRDPEVSGWNDDDASAGTKSGGIFKHLRVYGIPYTMQLRSVANGVTTCRSGELLKLAPTVGEH